MSDDFLAQIQKTEQEAINLIEKAQERAQQDFLREEQNLKDVRAKSLEKSRTKAKEILAKKQKEMRELYDKLTKEGQKNNSALEKEATGKKDKTVSSAFMYLLNELI